MAVQDIGLAPGFSINQVLNTSFSIWRKNLLLFAMLAFAVNIPLFAAGYLLFNGAMDLQSILRGNHKISEMVLVIVVMTAFYQFMAAAITYAVIQQLRGMRISLGDCFSRTLNRLVPVILTGLMFTVFMMVGMVLLVVPGLIVFTMYWVVVPVCVAENVSFMTCLNRCAELTKGHRWKILGLILVLGVVEFCIQKMIEPVVNAAVSANSPVTIIVVSASYFLVQQMLFSTFKAVATATAYYYLRVAKEGVDIDQIAAVFD